MIRRLGLRAGLLVLIVLLAACAGRQPRVDRGVAESALGERESLLQQQPDFGLSGRIGLSNGKEGGSGQFVWEQRGARFDFTLTVTITGDRYRLHGGPGRVTLVDAKGVSHHGLDAEALLAERTGWRVPVQQLGYWIRAMRAPGDRASAEFGHDGLLRSLRQKQWQIEYRGWSRDHEPQLPVRLQATRGAHRVRVVVRDWR